MNPQLEIRKIMQEDLINSQARNPSYSMRAFAKKVGLYSSAVSEILNGKRQVTQKMAHRILDRLNVSPDKQEKTLASFGKATRRKKAAIKSTNPVSPLNFIQIDMDQFHLVSDWHCFAVLSLADTRDFKDDPTWVAKRLRIKPQDARMTLDRLERLGLLAKNSDDRRVATGKQFSTTTDVVNHTLRKHHYQNLELARRALDEDELLERDFSFITMAVDPSKLPRIKEKIRNFRRELCAEFESGARKEVYKLCVQLFPLTKKESRL